MNKIYITMLALLGLGVLGNAQEWTPAGDNIRTEWAGKVTPANVHKEYPRPQMVRSEWQSLNGLWDYAITSQAEASPAKMDGQILVPFAVESSLSGVGRELNADQALWYKTSFNLPKEWKGKRVRLNFDAVDWSAEVWLNDILLGKHEGGYTSFSFDITPYLNGKAAQALTVKVIDYTDKGFQPRGKQVSKPEGIWYTRVSGIWQSVWLEPVADGNIADYNVVSDVDGQTLTVDVDLNRTKEGDIVKLELLEGKVGYDVENTSGKVLASVKAVAGEKMTLNVPDMQTWSPDSPYLYGLRMTLIRGGKAIDTVNGYTAMRKVSVVTDETSHKRLGLNNKALFQLGPLDQGWWPDGLYTAPTDEALKYDLIKTKELGFNMIRKHIKVEPSRWFYYCDQLGILVWQDMPCITDSRTNRWDYSAMGRGSDSIIPAEWQANYYREWADIIAQVKKFQCIVAWIPFNEAWGQFDTEKAVAFTKAQDKTRLVNPASGGNFRPCGDILDWHHYPNPAMWMYESAYVNVIGEFGGIGMPLEGHLWQKDRNWGYVQYKNAKEVTDTYVKYAEQLAELVKKGISAGVYTQTTDVEGEVNGFLTYDRKVVKMEAERVKAANQKVINALSK